MRTLACTFAVYESAQRGQVVEIAEFAYRSSSSTTEPAGLAI